MINNKLISCSFSAHRKSSALQWDSTNLMPCNAWMKCEALRQYNQSLYIASYHICNLPEMLCTRMTPMTSITTPSMCVIICSQTNTHTHTINHLYQINLCYLAGDPYTSVKRLPWTVRAPNLVQIAQVVFLSEQRQTHTPQKVTNITGR